MQLTLTRVVSGPESTIGVIRVDGEPACWLMGPGFLYQVQGESCGFCEPIGSRRAAI